MQNKVVCVRAACAIFTLTAMTACGAMGEATSGTFAQSSQAETATTGTYAASTGEASNATGTGATTSAATAVASGDSNTTLTTTAGVGGPTNGATTTTTSNTTSADSNATGGTTTGGAATTTGGTTTGNTACAETWTSYAQNFFATRCVGCHTSMGSYNNVASNASTIRAYIASRSMPRGSTLSNQDYNTILDWFGCTPATPE